MVERAREISDVQRQNYYSLVEELGLYIPDVLGLAFEEKMDLIADGFRHPSQM